MRRPTPRSELYRWHTEALAGWKPAYNGEEPQCGWYRAKLTKGGVWVPACIWMDQHVDMITGELLQDETLRCTVYHKERDPYEQWVWLLSNPASEQWYCDRMAELDWARKHAPDTPDGRPDVAVNWLTAPLPSFSKEEDDHE